MMGLVSSVKGQNGDASKTGARSNKKEKRRKEGGRRRHFWKNKMKFKISNENQHPKPKTTEN